jgi:hypothetical protein
MTWPHPDGKPGSQARLGELRGADADDLRQVIAA